MKVNEIPKPALYTDMYQLTMCQGYFKAGMHHKKAHFDFFFRKAPFAGEYVIFAGLADVLSVLKDFRFIRDELDWLEQQGFSTDFLKYLEKYRFDGTVISAREGEVVFPGQPVLTVSGSLLSCQLVETLLLNILNFQSLIATKARRLRLAAGDTTQLVDFGLRRGHGAGGIAASRAAVIGGFNASSNVLAAKRYGFPASGTMAHSWVQCFENELDAFRTYARYYPDATILLVDTYDTLRSGVPNAITVGRELEEKGHRLKGIRLDSGNQMELSRKSRSMLDDAGLDYVAIVASDQMDEKRILELREKQAPIDYFGVGTRLVTGYPDAALGGVYKICSYDGRPRMKTTDEASKRNLPGVKEIIRITDSDGQFKRDIIHLADDGGTTDSDRSSGSRSGNHENIRFMVMKEGRPGEHEDDVRTIADFCNTRVARLPDPIKRLKDPKCYEIVLDDDLSSLIEELSP